MVITSAEFIKSAVKPSQYPPADPPEIAFSGRSNVGKSSLINKLLNRRHLVKTSSTPGRTQLINFFSINEGFTFVDLPGYGYAKVPLQIRKKWGPMVETYLSSRKTLKGVVLVMDIRRIPREEERDFINWLNHNGLEIILVLTKTDKLSKARQGKQRKEIAESLSLEDSDLILFSAKSGFGKEVLWTAIETLLGS
ncbi:MAG TPA: YihA family ribosome biogenesis GTP-binding protein [Deltaproteobacteria bacterium]|nr:YihA family ribosome biogenesis GTP-binding protein [Deltaproteobacteria bacterium]